MNPPSNTTKKVDGNVTTWIMPVTKEAFKFAKVTTHTAPDSIFVFDGENRCILSRKGNRFYVKHDGDMYKDGIATFTRPEEAITFIAHLNDVAQF